MKRRAVLKAGVGGLVGMAALESGCATAPLRPEVGPKALDPEAAEAAIARIDERMASFNQIGLDIPENLPHHVQEELRTKAETARKTLRTFYLAGAFHQLDESLRYHPGVQERIRRMQGEMDRTVHDVTEHLASLTPAERKQIQQHLAADPELGSSLSRQVQDTMREDGFRFGQRAQLKYTFADLEHRMRTKDASAVIDRSVHRARSMRARGGQLDEGTYAALLGEANFRELKQRALGYAAGWESVYAARPRIDLARMDTLYPDDGGGGGVMTRDDLAGETTKPRPATTPAPSLSEPSAAAAPGGPSALTIGAWMLGIGGLIEAGGWVLFFAGGGSGPVATVGAFMCLIVGPLLLAIGLIVTLVGAVIAATAPRPSAAPPATAAPQSGAAPQL